MARERAPRARKWLQWASALLLIVAGCAQPPGSAQIAASAPPLPAGQARVWFTAPWSHPRPQPGPYRNDRYVGGVANGSAFYRDVPPGHYHVSPVSYNRDFNQDRDIDLAPGEQLYVKIVSSQSWDGACKNRVRDTCYAWLIHRRPRGSKWPAPGAASDGPKSALQSPVARLTNGRPDPRGLLTEK